MYFATQCIDLYTVEPLLRGQSDARPTHLKESLYSVP